MGLRSDLETLFPIQQLYSLFSRFCSTRVCSHVTFRLVFRCESVHIRLRDVLFSFSVPITFAVGFPCPVVVREGSSLCSLAVWYPIHDSAARAFAHRRSVSRTFRLEWRSS